MRERWSGRAHRRALLRGRRDPRTRMAVRQRLGIYGLLGGLWATGCAWLILDQYFVTPGAFGPTPNAWEAPLLLIHGIAAIAAMYLLGWVGARHVIRWWPGGLRRWSGSSLAALLAALVITGFALFFVSDDRWQHWAARSHDVLGLAVTLFGVQHWFFANRCDMRSAASRP